MVLYTLQSITWIPNCSLPSALNHRRASEYSKNSRYGSFYMVASTNNQPCAKKLQRLTCLETTIRHLTFLIVQQYSKRIPLAADHPCFLLFTSLIRGK